MTTASEDGFDIAIAGFGFGGLMVLANLVRLARHPLRIAVIAPNLSGHGLAYGTRNPEHLLNVSAANMGAWAHDIAHFAEWLNTPRAADARKALQLTHWPTAQDYAPRALYACYLTSILHHALAEAQQKSVTIEMIEAKAERAQREGNQWRIDAAGSTIIAQQMVLATGNEVKPIFPKMLHQSLQQNPWQLTADDLQGKGPIAIIGTGLTAVDTVLTLRRMGYAGDILAISRNGLLPQPHLRQVVPYAFDLSALLAQQQLSGLLRHVRRAVAQHRAAGHDWRGVVDMLRNQTQLLWQQLSPRDQLRAARRLATFWNVHRHRMAPEIAERLQHDGRLRIVASRALQLDAPDGRLRLTVTPRHGTVEILHPRLVINCTGPELNWARSSQALLQQLLQQKAVQPHPTGLGVQADPRYRVGEGLYAIGGLMTGQFWESTAVPELRGQAAAIAEALCR